MIEIFAIMGCFYFVDPKWSKANACQLMQPQNFTYRTAEECEDRIKQTFPEQLLKAERLGRAIQLRQKIRCHLVPGQIAGPATFQNKTRPGSCRAVLHVSHALAS